MNEPINDDQTSNRNVDHEKIEKRETKGCDLIVGFGSFTLYIAKMLNSFSFSIHSQFILEQNFRNDVSLSDFDLQCHE